MHTLLSLILVSILVWTTTACSQAEESPALRTSAQAPLAPPKAPAPQGDRLFSIDVLEAENEDYDDAMQMAKSLGAQGVSLTVFWDEIESAPGTFDPDPNWLHIANLYYPTQDVQVSFTISVIDTNHVRLPDDLDGIPFDDPVIIDRFTGLLDYIAGQIPDLNLAGLAIGNEIDIALGTDRNRWRQYEVFLRETAAHARRLWPEVPVGTKTTFDGIAGPQRPFVQSINQHSDVVMVTYYPLEGTFAVRPPESVHQDFKVLVDQFPGRLLYLLEVGYPSGQDNLSSPTQQADFIHELFLAWDRHADQIPLLTYTWLTDISDQAVEELTGYYGLNAEGFVSYLATLGLRTSSGEAKTALPQLKAETQARSWQSFP